MTYKSHPRWKYAVGKAVIVQDEAEEAALDGEWFDSPDELTKHMDEKARKIDEELRAKRIEKAGEDALNKQIQDLQNDLDKDNAKVDLRGGDNGDLDSRQDHHAMHQANPEELDDIETLRITATELGIDWHPRTGAKKLTDQIKAAIEAKGE